jgi:hypothetical protein
MQTPAILGSLRIPATAASPAPVLATALVGQMLEATLEAVLPEGLLLSLPDGKQLQTTGSLPFPPGSILTLQATALPEGAGIRLQVVRATPPPVPALLAPLARGEAASLLARLQAPGAAGDPLTALLQTLLVKGAAEADQPESWATWMKAAIKTLADPAASPTESVFHRLQAREQTGWFELPLPWAPAADPMRIWIEADQGGPGAEADPAHRVFLSVPFSTLGEVRVGLEQRRAGLRVRLWLQDPSQIAAFQSSLEAELKALGRPVDLQVFPLPPQAPDLRALAGGNPLEALG